MEKSKDPISYIFRIIRHIIEKYNCNNNSENIIKAWGKCIGQKLRGEEILEFNIILSNYSIINELVNILSITEILVNTINNNGAENSEKRSIQFLLNDKMIHLHIFSNLKYFTNYNYNYNYVQNDPDIYFTCDNLSIDLNGQISTIIPSLKRNDNYDTINWISLSISHAIHKKFSMISYIENKQLHKNIDFNIKYNELVDLGFSFVNDLTIPSKYYIFKKNTDITEFSDNRILSTKCAICFENYINSNESVLLSCLHDFHINCLHKWIIKKQYTCPCCRLEIKFTPSTKFGDSEIDNIIQNYPEQRIHGNIRNN